MSREVPALHTIIRVLEDGDGATRFIAATATGQTVDTVELDRLWNEYRVPLPPELLRTGRNRIELSGDLSATREGALRFLLLRIHADDGRDLFLERGSVEARPSVEEPSLVSRKVPASRPDIVVVIPDALRPDHLGLAGYTRDTSPNIDRLAREALVFPNAVATASYTLSSIGTVVTGLSPLRHGVLGRNHRLSTSVTTLAESLRDAGYRTLGVSANAYHSQQFGFDQGYDRFLQMWRVAQGDRRRSFDPHLAVEEARQLLRSGATDDRPLFLLMHLVPPHSPYDPPAAFDLFSSPSYRGPVGRTRDTYLRLSSGQLRPEPEDLAQLNGLYDGNIRRVDDAIGELLGLLRSRPRWNDTVVLVIADHGEAFGEHGFFGHTSTVYEEVIRVPFILRVPPDRTPEEVDLGSFVSLADVTPTLLGLAGVRPADGLDGFDLFDRSFGERSAERCVIVRSGGSSRPSYAVRSERWKAVVHELHQRDLFDIRSDPSEMADLSGEYPELVVGLAHLVVESLRQPRAGEMAGPLGAAEEEALRALGYVMD